MKKTFYGVITFLAAVSICGFSSAYEDTWVLRSKGYRYQQAGDFTKAIECYGKAIKLEPAEASLHNDLGVAYENKSDFKNAEKEYLLALEIDPDYLKAHTNLGFLYEHQKKLLDAAYHWKKRAELGAPDDPWTVKAQKRYASMPSAVIWQLQRKEENSTLEEESVSLSEELAMEKAQDAARAEEEYRLAEERANREREAQERQERERLASIVLTSTDLRTDYQVLGIIHEVSQAGDVDGINDGLRVKARDANADAVLLVNYFTIGNQLCGTGTAVKFAKDTTP